MTAPGDRSYQPLQPYGVEHGDGDEETPQDVMIHVVPESGRARWNHIEDLDSFFVRTYHYHQKHGFACMMVQECLELLQFISVVVFSSFLLHCVDYGILFGDKVVNGTNKITLSDAVLSSQECITSFGGFTWIVIFVAVIFWFLRAVKVVYHLFQFWDIKIFFNTALKIHDNDLDNLTWHEVQRRVRDVQREQQMCIHKRDLTELDIYHRILRFKNYMVAMINKNLLPAKLNIPLLGEIVFFTRGLKYNLEMLLFWGPWALFENNWHLREDYKKAGRRHDLAQQLSKHVLWVGIANFLLCPLILLWQILYSFFNYAEMIKREPGSLGSRRWSIYGRLYLRHFNELEHELNARLNRAYRPASQYMNSFTSPIMSVFAKFVAFIAGALFAVAVACTLYDDDLLKVEGTVTTITILGAIIAGARVFIPDENLVWCPEKLMTAVLAHVHYLPDSWRGQAHTHRVRNEFSQIFQYKAVYLLEELLSPIITPFILCFIVRHRALDIVDFYRNFTVEVVGVGDVCSFAQMDVRRHGNPLWQTKSVLESLDHTGDHKPSQQTPAEDGKTELSLFHFTHTNPEWSPPDESQQNFVTSVRNHARRDADELTQVLEPVDNALLSSLRSVSSLGDEFSSLITSLLRGNQAPGTDAFVGAGVPSAAFAPDSSGHEGRRPALGGLTRAEGPLHYDLGLLHSLQQRQEVTNSSLGTSAFGRGASTNPNPIDLTAADMSLSTLYLHELHQRHVSQDISLGRSMWQQFPLAQRGQGDQPQAAERTPLLTPAAKSSRNS
ncbi:autophagy-related protein 9A [Bacillus rossius redtenbacheri]|uniref:autophagy-related protein 9A n=1 Tax=Bacillus rossius redtenbacheri TaxID=93214 RepID=UPI002FDEA098